MNMYKHLTEVVESNHFQRLEHHPKMLSSGFHTGY